MDAFAEQLVRKYTSTADDVRKVCIIVIAILVAAVSVLLAFLGFSAALLLAFAAPWGAAVLLKSQYVEYEYSCTNGSLDIDKIIGKKKRKTMLTVDVRTFTAFVRCKDDSALPEAAEERTIFSVMGMSLMGEEEDTTEDCYAEFDHPDYGKCCLYFSPDENLRNAILPFLSRELQKS